MGSGLIHFQHIIASGGSPSLAATTWATVPLNTVQVSQVSGATLVGNQIQLPAGTYVLDARTSLSLQGTAGVAQPRIYNITDSANVLAGLPAGSPSESTMTTLMCVRGKFTLAGTKNLELQAYFNGAGSAFVGYNPGGNISRVTSDIMIWKVA
jgi:hypothetical protein